MTILDEQPSSPGVQTLGDNGPAAAQALFEEARQRRKRRRRLAGVVMTVVLLIVTVTVVVVIRRPRTPNTLPPTGLRPPTSNVPVSQIPPQMVVWSQGVASLGGFSIDVISSKTGHLIRTLATDVAVNSGLPQPTVAPSGIVYFDNAYDVNSTPNEQILSVPLTGGPVTVVADGHDPVISPNGDLLAYLTNDFTPPEGIVVRNLVTGASSTWEAPNNSPFIAGLSWAPGSKSLSFTMTTGTTASAALEASVLDLSSPSRSLDAARKIPLAPGVAWAGYLNATQGIGVIQHVVRFSNNRDWFELMLVDVTTGRIVKRLQTVSGQIGGGGLGGGVQVDPSGRHLAVDVSNSSGWSNLYRWTISTDPARISAGPILVKKGVLSEAWVPGSSPINGLRSDPNH